MTSILDLLPQDVLIQTFSVSDPVTKTMIAFTCTFFRDNISLEGMYKECLCTFAAAEGHIEIVKWAIDNNCYWSRYAVIEASSGGHLELLKWVDQLYKVSYYSVADNYCYYAATGGHLETLKWLLENGNDIDDGVVTELLGSGNVEAVRWLLEQDGPWIRDCRLAARNGHLDVLKLVGTLNAIQGAADGDQVHILEWALDVGLPWDLNALGTAILSNSHRVIEWILTKGLEFYASPCMLYAARKGNIRVLKFLHNTRPVNANRLIWTNSVPVLKWALKKGYKLNNEITMLAARRGDIETIQWLRDNGYEWDSLIPSTAAQSGQLEALEWLRDNGCPCDLHVVKVQIVERYRQITNIPKGRMDKQLSHWKRVKDSERYKEWLR